MTHKSPSFQFYSGDWLRDPGLRACSPATRGIWIDMLCLMDQSKKRGFFMAGNQNPTDEVAARMLGISPEEYRQAKQELLHFDICSVDEEERIFSRRMVRDEKERIAWRERQRKLRERETFEEKSSRSENNSHPNQLVPFVPISNSCHGSVTEDVTPLSPPSSSSPSSSSEQKIKKKLLKKKSSVPEKLEITPEMETWAKSKGANDLEQETEKFLDFHRAKGTLFTDWIAAWRTWIRNSIQFKTSNRARAGPHLSGSNSLNSQIQESSGKYDHLYE